MSNKNKHAGTTPERPGDVLGLSDANPNVQIPKPANPGSGHATGLDVGSPATGIGEMQRGKGATGIDMGAAGSGTDVKPHSSRPHTTEREEEKK